jgi:Ala-tRNA(Pro) deacylase
MEILTKIEQYCKNNNLDYQKIQHEPAASADEYHSILGTRYEQQAKALLLRYKKSGEKGFFVVGIQAQKKVDLQLIKNISDVKDIRLAEVSQLKEATGCNFGELPPIGSIFGFKLFLDKDLLDEDLIYFNAGSLTTSFVISPKKLQIIENPQIF